jgi:type II secretory pathway pseudopilin PulG
VIAIIAILAAILFPVFAQAKVAAKKTQDLSNVKQIALATAMYSVDYDDYFPSAYGRHCGIPQNLGNGSKNPGAWVIDGREAVPYNWFVEELPYLQACISSNQYAGADGNVNGYRLWPVSAGLESAPNTLSPYIKNWDIFYMPGAPLQSGVYTPLPDDGTPAHVSYNMNGLVSSYSQTAVVDPSGEPVWWPGFGQVARIGDTYADPFLICPDPTQQCVFNPGGVVINDGDTCDAVAANSNSFLGDGNTQNGTQAGFGNIHWTSWCFGKVENWSFADGHAKSRPMATGDQNLDPFPIAGYVNGVPDSAPGYEPHNAVFDQYCEIPLFRPDITHTL